MEPLLLCPPSGASTAIPPAIFSEVLVVDDAGRPGVEDFIRAVYKLRFGANLSVLAPHLFVLRKANGSLVAAAGLHQAQDDVLYLERYLDAPIDEILSTRLGIAISRGHIIEVSNLAARFGETRTLIQVLTPFLYGAGYRWVVFTAIQRLRNTFRRMGIPLITLCPADPQRLGEECHPWGSYYHDSPMVMAGEIAEGLRCLQARPILGEVSCKVSRSIMTKGLPL